MKKLWQNSTIAATSVLIPISTLMLTRLGDSPAAASPPGRLTAEQSRSLKAGISLNSLGTLTSVDAPDKGTNPVPE